MKTIRTKVYQFSELSAKAKLAAIEDNREINMDYYWYQPTFEDAKDAGLKLENFDTDSASFVRDLTGEFITCAGEVVEYILANHGKDCETYKTALKYKNQFQLTSDETNEDELCKIEDSLLDELLMDYTKLLQEDMEYREMDSAVIETLVESEMYFTKDGKRFNQ